MEAYVFLGKVTLYCFRFLRSTLIYFFENRLLFIDGPYLLDREVNQCNCQKKEKNGVSRFWKFQTLDQFIENCNFSEVHSNYQTKVFRRDVLSLKQIAKGYISSNGMNIDSIEIPITLKEELKNGTFENHEHYKIALNEKKAEKMFSVRGWEHYLFKISPNGWMPITHKIWIQNEADASEHRLQGLTLKEYK